MTEHFDVVVIGSGFGGSVTSCRLAEAGLSVCVLERGRSYPPGSFPRNPHRMKYNFWDPSEGYFGLYDLWTGTDLGGVVASGLGGGSLIYANVLLRKDERSFVRKPGEYWPVTRAELDPHYDRVTGVLAPQRFPIEAPPYDRTHRALEFRSAARSLGLEWFAPDLAVTFANPGRPPALGEPIDEATPNLHGSPRQTCRLCAECCFGCNYGSKNTLDLNYLTLAQDAGAHVRTLCEVRELRPAPGIGYLVRYVRHDLRREGRPTATQDTTMLPLQDVTAERVVLAAGTFGSTFLLLRNRNGLPGLSDRLGANFSTNGDMLAVGRRCRVNGRQRIIEADVGTSITGGIRIPPPADAEVSVDSYLEDMGYPAFLSWLLQLVDFPNTVGAIGRLVPRLLAGLCDRHSPSADLDGDVATLFGSTEASVSTLPVIGVGSDVPDGRLSLHEGRLEIRWRAHASTAYFEQAQRFARSVVHALGGRYLDTRSGLLRYGVTMHPLGGCPMGRNPDEGVVDRYGEVFGHPGLFVADGSVMPGPVGANPSLTIAALADRTADRMLAVGS